MCPYPHLDEVISLKKDGPTCELSRKKRPKTPEQFPYLAARLQKQSMELDLPERELSRPLPLVLLRHQVSLNPVNWTRNDRLNQRDAETCEELQEAWIVANAQRRPTLVEIWQSYKQGVLVGVSQHQPCQIRQGSCVESFHYSLALVDAFCYLILVLVLRVGLPLNLDGVDRVLEREPDDHARQANHCASKIQLTPAWRLIFTRNQTHILTLLVIVLFVTTNTIHFFLLMNHSMSNADGICGS